MVNWDPEAKTTLSDEEVVYEEQQGNYILKYKIEGSEDFLTIATTRPKQYLEIVRFVLTK
jgi:valyl-tRNA synthetase